jgi:hypothetical protein
MAVCLLFCQWEGFCILFSFFYAISEFDIFSICLRYEYAYLVLMIRYQHPGEIREKAIAGTIIMLIF